MVQEVENQQALGVSCGYISKETQVESSAQNALQYVKHSSRFLSPQGMSPNSFFPLQQPPIYSS